MKAKNSISEMKGIREFCDQKNLSKGYKKMISDHITRDEVLLIVSQAEMLKDFSGINVPCLKRSGNYNSLKDSFDKLSGSRSRCFTCCLFKHTFSELVEAERVARDTKLSKNDVTNLFERLGQLCTSFFALHAKSDLRSAYKTQYLTFLRSMK